MKCSSLIMLAMCNGSLHGMCEERYLGMREYERVEQLLNINEVSSCLMHYTVKARHRLDTALLRSADLSLSKKSHFTSTKIDVEREAFRNAQ